MRFQVPQFIEIEDKIFGPFTFKQFIYLAGGAGFAVGMFVLLPSKILSIIVSLPVITLSLALTFYKVNNQPFITVLESAFRYVTTQHLYIWKKVPKKIQHGDDTKTDVAQDISVPRLSDSKLKELAWSLDIHDNAIERAHEAEITKRNATHKTLSPHT